MALYRSKFLPSWGLPPWRRNIINEDEKMSRSQPGKVGEEALMLSPSHAQARAPIPLSTGHKWKPGLESQQRLVSTSQAASHNQSCPMQLPLPTVPPSETARRHRMQGGWLSAASQTKEWGSKLLRRNRGKNLSVPFFGLNWFKYFLHR